MKQKRSFHRRGLLISSLLIGAVLMVGAWVAWGRNNNDTAEPTAKKTAQPSIPKTPDELPDTVVTTPDPNADPNVPGGSTGSDVGDTLAPAAPSGAFVSNHTPSISGRNQLSSACNTTEGASCVISFTKGGVTKSLESKKTDKNGSVAWDWTLQQVGLTAGSWKVKATATLNGKSKSAEDTLPLDVTP